MVVVLGSALSVDFTVGLVYKPKVESAIDSAFGVFYLQS
jgi:hypothetical protein